MIKLTSNTLTIFESATNEKDIENGDVYTMEEVIEELEKVRSLKKQLDDLEQRISNRFAK